MSLRQTIADQLKQKVEFNDKVSLNVLAHMTTSVRNAIIDNRETEYFCTDHTRREEAIRHFLEESEIPYTVQISKENKCFCVDMKKLTR